MCASCSYHFLLFLFSQAKQLVGSSLLVREDDRPELEEGEFYSRDLLGMRVTLKVWTYHGIVSNILKSLLHFRCVQHCHSM